VDENARAPSPKALLGALVLGLALLAVWSQRAGFLVDDLALAATARERSWGELLSSWGTFPYQLPLWRLAVAASPRAPYLFVRLAAFAFHGASAVLVWRLLRERFAPGPAVAGAAAFFAFRPGNESLLWAGASNEVSCLFFALLAWGLWEKGPARPALRWGAVLCAAAAMASKSSAVILPLVLAASTLWLEEGEGASHRLRCARMPLLVAAMAVALLAMRALGTAAEPVTPAGVSAGPLERLSELGLSLARLVILVDPRRLGFPGAVGLLVLAGAGILLLKGPPVLRFATLWAGAFLAPPVMARGLAQPRYAYPAAVGAALALPWLLEKGRESRRGRVWIAAGAALWLALNLALDGRDLAVTKRCGALNERVRILLGEHAGEVSQTEGFVAARRPPIVRPTDILRYDAGKNPRVVLADACERGRPCLWFAEFVPTADGCPAGGLARFARFSARGDL
jgi:hypothetical protein